MSLLVDLKQRLFLRQQRQRLAAQGQDPVFDGPLNPVTAGRITVLFPAENAEHRKLVDRWRDAHHRRDCKIEVLGFFPADVGQASFDFMTLSPKHLNWFGAPKGSEVESFLKNSTDLLIRLGPVQHRELDYLAALKPAALRVGPQTAAADNPYHLRYESDDGGPGPQLKAIERIFSFTNAAATPSV